MDLPLCHQQSKLRRISLTTLTHLPPPPRPYMSQLYDIPVCLPAHFGYPYLLPTECQLTEPFWWQYPSWTQPSYHQRHYQYAEHPNHHSHIKRSMDSQTTYIGSNTKDGRKVQDTENDGVIRKQKPKGDVEVYINDTFIRKVKLSTLVRFSKRAAREFPKPPEIQQPESKPVSVDAGTCHRNWSDDSDQLEEQEYKDMVEQVRKLDVASKDKPKSESKAEPNDLPSRSELATKTLDLYTDSLWYQPAPETFSYAFAWMNLAKDRRHNEHVPDYCPSRPDELSLRKLVDMYAAALCLDIRPFPHTLRHAIMKRVTEVRPLKLDVQYVHEHLPIDDTVLTRLLTALFEHKYYRKRNTGYSDVEWKLITDYIYNSDEALLKRVQEIEDNRHQRRLEHKQRKEGDVLQQHAQLLQDPDEFPNLPQPSSPIPAVASKTGGTADDGKVEQGGGRRRNRRAQQKKGQGVNGREVPGADS